MPLDKSAQVYRTLNAGPANDAAARVPLLFQSAGQSAGGLLDFMRSRGNALESAACRVAPVIAEVKRAIEATPGCAYAAVSGGGPTCFGVFADSERAAADLQRNHSAWWVKKVVLG